MNDDQLWRGYEFYLKRVVIPAGVTFCSLCLVLAVLDLTVGIPEWLGLR